MLLSEYDRVVCLCVDRRLRQEQGRLWPMLSRHGVMRERFSIFLEGEGELFHPDTYDQITPDPPPGWTQSRGAYAHFAAMKAVVRRAQDDGIAHLLWVEDDCVLLDNFDRVVAEATAQLRRAGIDRWDLLYYGANHSWANTYDVAPNVLRCYGSLTTHCVGIPAATFDKILSLPPAHVIDKVIADTLHHDGACYAVWPNVAVQKPGYSAISNVPCDYSQYFLSRGINRA